MHHEDRFADLDALSKWQLVNEEQDIRGYPVRSVEGQEYGKIEDMLVDKDREEVLAVRMEDGRLVAAEHLDIHDDYVIYTRNEGASRTDYTHTRVRSRT